MYLSILDHHGSVSGVLHQPLPLRCLFHKVESFTPATAVQSSSLVQTCQSISCGNATCSQYCAEGTITRHLNTSQSYILTTFAVGWTYRSTHVDTFMHSTISWLIQDKKTYPHGQGFSVDPKNCSPVGSQWFPDLWKLCPWRKSDGVRGGLELHNTTTDPTPRWGGIRLPQIPSQL